MKSWPRVLAASARRRRLAMLVAAAAMAPFAVLDFFLGPGVRLGVIGTAWTLTVLGGALLQRERWPQACGAGVLAATLATAIGAAAMVLLSGGTASPLFGLFLALPPCIALFFPELPGMALGTAVASIGAGCWLRLHEGRSTFDVLYWGALATAVAVLAVCAAALIRRQAERELALERDRRQALEALARAEVARLQLERLAEAGRLAAKVAHDVNGPLSAARSNLTCLLADRSAPADERQAALQETMEAVQKIIDTVGGLQAVMWRAGKPAAPEKTPPALRLPPIERRG